jgi:uncharacterized protein (TIGR04222 family)
MNPFNLTGPEFLVFYGVTLVFAVAAVCIVRQLLRRGSVVPTARRHDLDPFELAYLAGGPVRTVQAALVSLVNRKAVTVAADGKLTANATIGGLSPAEAVVHEAVTLFSNTVFGKIVLRARTGLQKIEDQLIGAGLLVPPATRSLATLVGVIVMLAVLVVGIAKVLVGLDRHKNVGFLVLGCFVTFIVMIVFAAKKLRRTPAGDAALNEWTSRNERLRLATTPRQDDQLMLGVALFGPALLAGTALADLQRPISPPGAGTSWDGGGSSCGGSSCGGSSCGGGGCGGCGGGGD